MRRYNASFKYSLFACKSRPTAMKSVPLYLTSALHALCLFCVYAV